MEGRGVLVGILWLFYLYLICLRLGSVAWDATGGWSCDEITPLLRAPLLRLASLVVRAG